MSQEANNTDTGKLNAITEAEIAFVRVGELSKSI